MSRRILGKTFDIHGGGLDLIFPIMKMNSRKAVAAMVSRWCDIGCTMAW